MELVSVESPHPSINVSMIHSTINGKSEMSPMPLGVRALRRVRDSIIDIIVVPRKHRHLTCQEFAHERVRATLLTDVFHRQYSVPAQVFINLVE